MATERPLWQSMMPARHTKLCFCGAPFLWRPLFSRTSWTCLNPPLLIIGFVRPPTDSRKVIMFTSVFFWHPNSNLADFWAAPRQKHQGLVPVRTRRLNWNRTFRPLFPSCNVQLSYHRRQLQTDLQNFWAKTVLAYFLLHVCLRIIPNEARNIPIFSRYLRHLYR